MEFKTVSPMQRFSHRLQITTTLMLACLILSWPQLSHAALPESLEISIDHGWMPYIYKNEQSQLCGSDTLLLSSILTQLHIRLSSIPLPENRLTRAIETGDIDIVVGAAKNPERQKNYLYSQSYRQEIIGFATNRANFADHPHITLTELLKQGGLVALNINGWFGAQFESTVKQPFAQQLIHVDGSDRRMQMLQLHRVDAVLDDVNVLRYTAEKLQFSQMKVMEQLIFEQPVYFMFSRKSVDYEFIRYFDQKLLENRINFDNQCLPPG